MREQQQHVVYGVSSGSQLEWNIPEVLCVRYLCLKRGKNIYWRDGNIRRNGFKGVSRYRKCAFWRDRRPSVLSSPFFIHCHATSSCFFPSFFRVSENVSCSHRVIAACKYRLRGKYWFYFVFQHLQKTKLCCFLWEKEGATLQAFQSNNGWWNSWNQEFNFLANFKLKFWRTS